MTIVYKQVSYKNCEEGETLKVSHITKFMNESNICKIEKDNVWNLTPEEKDMLLESIVDTLRRLEGK